jgi:hypothetical protein
VNRDTLYVLLNFLHLVAENSEDRKGPQVRNSEDRKGQVEQQGNKRTPVDE